MQIGLCWLCQGKTTITWAVSITGLFGTCNAAIGVQFPNGPLRKFMHLDEEEPNMVKLMKNAKPLFTPEQREACRKLEEKIIQMHGSLIHCPELNDITPDIIGGQMHQLNATKESSSTPSED